MSTGLQRKCTAYGLVGLSGVISPPADETQEEPYVPPTQGCGEIIVPVGGLNQIFLRGDPLLSPFWPSLFPSTFGLLWFESLSGGLSSKSEIDPPLYQDN